MVAKCAARSCQRIFWPFTVSSDNLLKRPVVFLWRTSNDINKIPMHNALILRHSYAPCIWNDKCARQQNICWHLWTTACLSNSFSALTCVIRFFFFCLNGTVWMFDICVTAKIHAQPTDHVDKMQLRFQLDQTLNGPYLPALLYTVPVMSDWQHLYECDWCKTGRIQTSRGGEEGSSTGRC